MELNGAENKILNKSNRGDLLNVFMNQKLAMSLYVIVLFYHLVARRALYFTEWSTFNSRNHIPINGFSLWREINTTRLSPGLMRIILRPWYVQIRKEIMALTRDNFLAELKTQAGQAVSVYSLPKLAQHFDRSIDHLPYSIRVLLENILRHVDGQMVTMDSVEAILSWDAKSKKRPEIPYMPARVVMQDFTGVPAVVDFAAMREAFKKAGGDPQKINPSVQTALVVDHSVQVDHYGNPTALKQNIGFEYRRNKERYGLLKWAQNSLDNFKVVPPGMGIIHQVNLEYLAQVVMTQKDEQGRLIAYPDTLVGTDSHTTMINGLGVLGWGVGGIEAESVMLGQTISMVLPEVIGFKLTG